jgi:hypothetical protein
MAKMKRANYKLDANYDQMQRKEPARRMGEGDYANLPREPIYREFGKPIYRDGLINSFDGSIVETSGIAENESHNDPR